MAVIVAGLIVTAIILVLSYFLRSSDNGGDPSIPYATYSSYPIIGHLIPFVRDRVKLLIECRQRYGECFRIRVCNKYFTMIASHADWMGVVRNQSFEFKPGESGERLFDTSPAPFNHTEFDEDTHRLYVQHLKNRNGLRPMIVAFIQRARQLIKNDKAAFEKNGSESKWISTGLLEFSHHMLYAPSTLALIGDIDPSALESDFHLFDKQFHYFMIPFPDWFGSWFLSREYEARSRLKKSWLKNPIPPGASEFHRDQMALFSNNSEWLTEKDYTGILTGFFWASLGNTIPGVFWSLFYILRDPKALATIKEEIDKQLPAVPLDIDSNDSDIEDWTPEQIDSCVYLESAVNEALRLAAAIFMTRQCVRESQVVLQDGRTLTIKLGETLAWFGGASHFDTKLFPEPNKFVFDRFLNKKVDSVPGFMPFGGGKSICPGRFFAKSEIKTCAAMLLRYMEYKLEDTETIPSPIKARVGFGIAPPSKDVPIMYRYTI